jgi:hypothetical protein
VDVYDRPVTNDRPAAVLAAFVLAVMLATIASGAAIWAATSDFRAFYVSARAWLLAQPPYLPAPGDPNNLNPPATLLIFAPFAAGSLATGYVAWTASTLACLWLALRLIVAQLPARPWPLLLLIAVLPFSGLLAVRLGQVTWPLLLLLTLAWYADRRDERVRLGLLVGAVIYVKPFLAVLAIDLVARRRWTACVAAVCALIALALVGFALVGLEGHLGWFALIQLQLHYGASHLNASIVGLVDRLFAASEGPAHMTPIAIWPTAHRAVSSIAAIGIVAMIAVQYRRTSTDRRWALLLVGSVLLSPLGWVYYVPIALGPIAAGWPTASRGSRACQVAALICFLVPPFSKEHTFGLLATITIASAYAWGLLLLFVGLLMRPCTPQALPG